MRRFLSRRRILLVALVLAVAAVAYLVFRPASNLSPMQQKCAQIKRGMTLEEVMRILGEPRGGKIYERPPGVKYFERGDERHVSYTWHFGPKEYVQVVFDADSPDGPPVVFYTMLFPRSERQEWWDNNVRPWLRR
jgi:hypothetical protein